MDRNLELEKRIKFIFERDKELGINSYEGIYLTSVSNEIYKMRLEEMKYMKNHPEIYKQKLNLWQT